MFENQFYYEDLLVREYQDSSQRDKDEMFQSLVSYMLETVGRDNMIMQAKRSRYPDMPQKDDYYKELMPMWSYHVLEPHL